LEVPLGIGIRIWSDRTIKDVGLPIIAVRTLGLEKPADCLLDLHNGEYNGHGNTNSCLPDAIHATNAEQELNG